MFQRVNILLIRAERLYSTGTTRKYVPRRALMYVPGDDEKKLKKMQSVNVDCIVMNCEDGIAANKKEKARHTIKSMLGELNFKRAECAVRVNSLSSNIIEEDLKVILSEGNLPQTIVLPKVEYESDLDTFENLAKEALKSRQLNQPFRFIYMIESAIGLLNMACITKKAHRMSKSGIFFSEAVIFGSDDFIADIGASKREDLANLTYARQKIVTIAKAFGLQAIDAVYINLKDEDGLKTISENGASLGFTGKQVIHPAQIDIVQNAFSPSPEQVHESIELIMAYNEHQRSGKGAFTFRQKMIDKPLLLQAKRIVTMYEALKTS